MAAAIASKGLLSGGQLAAGAVPVQQSRRCSQGQPTLPALQAGNYSGLRGLSLVPTRQMRVESRRRLAPGISCQLSSSPHWPLAVVSTLATPFDLHAAPLSLDLPPLNPVYGEVGAVLELSVQLIYLLGLLALLGTGSFLVVRQVLIRRELENAAKDLQDRVRMGIASAEEYFELGAVMLRKRLYIQANRYLEQAIQKWEGDPEELAQVYNALGFSYTKETRYDEAVAQFEKALRLQPGYVTARNNLGDAYEQAKQIEKALQAYEQALRYDPNNNLAKDKVEALRRRVDRRKGVTSES
ncbi:hypothetical protein KFL_001260170 [Klebsormidium nitens]|uniref:Uncharacterized protein n=1 Tax=Klebsormidium nitens TaxID=105231 RepID=A0A1Y1I278_KLENI|nr:hypothetical protein KFL_001260170 [Klebsormidium nitens]|eukprot:GAQ82847.1 hypothetical protein KFL_001260170 [Klebsormidium nitens]